jgi:hypothetical protein
MTQTLTTERLKDLTFHRSKLIFPASHEEAAAMASEILANREAQPVGFYTTVSGRGGVIWHNGAPEDDTAIYTAPPAPAVPEVDFDEWFKREFHPDKTGPYVKNQMRFCWDACRAAMLKGAK